MYVAFDVIRVEPTERPSANDEAAIVGAQNLAMDVEYDSTSAAVSGKDDVGRGVARTMFGTSVFRGVFTKVGQHCSSCLFSSCTDDVYYLH